MAPQLSDGRVGKMYRDMYEGNGQHNPSMTTRMAAVEAAVASIKYYFRVIVVLMLGLLAHAVWDTLRK